MGVGGAKPKVEGTVAIDAKIGVGRERGRSEEVRKERGREEFGAQRLLAQGFRLRSAEEHADILFLNHDSSIFRQSSTV